MRFKFFALIRRKSREGQDGIKETGDKTPANPLAILRFYSCNIQHLWHISEKSKDP